MRYAIWNMAFGKWLDHDKAGHRLRARVWGAVSDTWVRVFDRVGWGE